MMSRVSQNPKNTDSNFRFVSPCRVVLTAATATAAFAAIGISRHPNEAADVSRSMGERTVRPIADLNGVLPARNLPRPAHTQRQSFSERKYQYGNPNPHQLPSQASSWNARKNAGSHIQQSQGRR